MLEDVFPAGLPRHEVGNAGARSNRDTAGQGGCDGDLLLPHAWVLSHLLLLDTVPRGWQSSGALGSPTKLTGSRSSIGAGCNSLPPSCHAKWPRREQEPGAYSTPIPRIIR